MWATASARERLLLPGWAAFAGSNAALMYVVPGAETIPFHFVWVSTALVYGLRPWSLRLMWATCALVTLVTGVPLVLDARSGVTGWQETTEIPLMALLFLVMVWHVRRRMAATDRACRLAESERLGRERQRRFVRFASHELRTPITVARGFTELLRQGRPELDADEDIAVVLDELTKLEGIAARLLALAQSDEVSATSEDIDVSRLLERTARRWQAAAPRRRWQVESARVQVHADPTRLEAALDSIVENAVRHTCDNGTIVLRATRSKAEVVLQVEDDGLGIEHAELPLVFEGFHSAGPHAGTGLGLAIVKAVAEAHGGRVLAANGRSGGAVISMVLPATTSVPAVVPA
jgi:two-component system, OmpR family, sensor kinase